MGDNAFDGPEVRTRCLLRSVLATPRTNGRYARRGVLIGRVDGFTEDGKLCDNKGCG